MVQLYLSWTGAHDKNKNDTINKQKFDYAFNVCTAPYSHRETYSTWSNNR